MVPYLDVQNLTKSFGALVLFKDICFSIAEGQKVGLIAKNGTEHIDDIIEDLSQALDKI